MDDAAGGEEIAKSRRHKIPQARYQPRPITSRRPSSARPQRRLGAGQFMRRRTDVHPRVVQDEVLEGHELAGEPKACAGVLEMGSADPAFRDLARAQAFVEPGEHVPPVLAPRLLRSPFPAPIELPLIPPVLLPNVPPSARLPVAALFVRRLPQRCRESRAMPVDLSQGEQRPRG